MQHRWVRLRWLLGSSIAAACIGAAIALAFATWFFRYGQDAAALADETLATTTLEHLASNDANAASEILRLQLRASLETLATRGSHLTPRQKMLLSNSEPLLWPSGSHTQTDDSRATTQPLDLARGRKRRINMKY